MQTAFQAKKTPVTLLALAIGLALQMQPGAVLAQQATEATTDAPAQGNDPAAAQAVPAQTATPAQDRGTELDSVVVTGSYRISLEKALDIKRTEKGVVDAIVADDVGKFPDLNLAESLQRVPGVTVMRDAGEGRQISVRGLNADFTRVRINGMEALATIGATDGSGGVNRGRSFDFNTFASELFSQMLVRKTASPEVEEGSLGATVDLRTARPFDYEGFTFSASGQMGYSDLSDDAKPRGSMLISNTWADQRFGALFSVAYTDRTTVEEGAGSGRWAQGTSNGNFDPSSPFAAARLASTMHPRFPRYILQEHDQKRLGITTSLQFAPSDRTEVSLDALYAKFKANRTEDYIEAISFSRGASQGGKPQTVVIDGEIDGNNNLVYGLFDNVDVRSESRFDKATTTFTQVGLSFDHKFSDDFSMSGLVGRSKSDFDKPIETTIIMDKLNVDGYSWDYRGNSRLPVISYGVSPTDPTGWTLAEVRVRPSRVVNTFDNAQLDFDWGISPGFRLKGGVLSKKYVFDSNEWRRPSELVVPTFSDGTTTVPASWVVLASLYGINAPGNSTWVVPDYQKFVNEFNVNGNTGIFAVSDRPVNTRSVEEKDNGVYIQGEFDMDLGSIPLSGNFGVRYVKTKQTSTGFATVSGTPVRTTVEREYTDTLPSFNLVAEITPDFLIRLAGAKVMARPGLGFLTPGVTVNVAGGARTVTGGNPNLDPFRATTGDLSFEWYFQEGALLGLGFFYKDIESFVQNARETRPYSTSGLPVSLLAGTGAGPEDEFTFTIPLNTPGGPLKGVELNYQQPFSFLPGNWSNLGVQFNYTYVDSKIQYMNNTGSLSLKTDLTGLSRNAYGATLYYDGNRFSGRVSAAKRDDYLTAVPAADVGNDVQGTHGTTNIDASLSWKLNDHWELTLEGLNLTNEWASTWNDSVAQRVESYTHSGRQYLVGARFKF
ncbi:TonB-dependent receptor [Lysobacter sp. CFH 32150]|uniref:TonB-dependent receptor n=1 Tax=Lysobacter sp. CFH 32150 TaxID=2927128 RepID=UPI001FA6F8A4|nr:TonB-dependent receptor [Lysobacter sp. CFH 32150]MCI4567949.1 TonB-dependent receptor [Lysobacter sp. CFH 32150]